MEIKKGLYVPIPTREKAAIIVVGIGGTGSHVASDMARIVYHGRSQGIDVDLLLVDPDVVEPKNVGRQRFSRAEVGMNKAEAKARALSRWLGIEVKCVPDKFSDSATIPSRWYTSDTATIIIGCLDDSFGNDGRRQISEAISTYDRLWWIDSGNDRYSGQVLVGNVGPRSSITMNKSLGVVNGLPAPHIAMPGLLAVDDGEANDHDLSCAELTVTGEQSLFVNSTMATVVSQYVYDMLFRGRIDAMATHVNLNPVMACSSVLITRDALLSRGCCECHDCCDDDCNKLIRLEEQGVKDG